MKNLFLPCLILAALIASCHQESSKKETISLDEVVSGSSTSKSTLDTVQAKEPIAVSFLKMTAKLSIPESAILTIDTLLFIDRYDHVSNYKYTVQADKKSFFAANWKFSSQAASKNAFVNWTQCYGSTCKSLNLNDSISVSNENMGMLLFGNELFYFSKIKQQQFMEIIKFIIAENKLKTIDFAFYQDGKKGVKWYQFDDFKK